jgi:hypothetical protein
MRFKDSNYVSDLLEIYTPTKSKSDLTDYEFW